MDFFGTKQTKGQLFSDWAAKLKSLGEEADLYQLTTEDMKYLTGVVDEKLRTEFLKEAKPTLKLLDKIVHQYEIAAFSVKAMTSQDSEVRQVSQGMKQQTKIPSSKELMDQGKCVRCGTAGHSAPDCRHKTSLCHSCQQTGHLKRVCQATRHGRTKNKARAVAQATEEDPGEYESDQEQKTTDVMHQET